MTPSETCDRWDVVVVPFPFVERWGSKRRPALVLSPADFNGLGHTVLAMITTAPGGEWPTDVRIHDLTAAGLPAASVVRLKLFTLDNRLILRRAGALASRDRQSATRVFREVLPG